MNWSKNNFKRANYKIKKLKRRLDTLHKLPPTRENIDERCKIRKEVKDLWKQEEIYWGSRAKINWLKWGDRNTKYFHASAVQRREINSIRRIKDKHGNWVEQFEEIKQVFKDYFEDLF